MEPELELRNLLTETLLIFNSEDDWESKYDLIFSERISMRVFELTSLDYYDPDTTYEEDVTAFVRAFQEAME